jgi:hypothetical protein
MNAKREIEPDGKPVDLAMRWLAKAFTPRSGVRCPHAPRSTRLFFESAVLTATDRIFAAAIAPDWPTMFSAAGPDSNPLTVAGIESPAGPGRLLFASLP